MKINIKPDGYLAEGDNNYREYLYNPLHVEEVEGNGHRVEPLYRESLVLELLESLAALDEAYCNAGSDMSREDRHAGRVALIKARALFARVTGGGAP